MSKKGLRLIAGFLLRFKACVYFTIQYLAMFSPMFVGCSGMPANDQLL